LEAVRWTRGRRPGAALRHVALARRGTTRGGRGSEVIRRTDLARAGAALRDVARTSRWAARRGRRRVNRVAVTGVLIGDVGRALIGSGALRVGRHPAVGAHVSFVDRAVAVVVESVANLGCRGTNEACDVQRRAIALRPRAGIRAELVRADPTDVVVPARA